MKIIEWFKNRFRDEAKHYLYVSIPSSRVRFSDGRDPDDTPLVAGNHYFQLWLTEMFLANDRDWFSNWHPAVHSAVEFRFGDNDELISRVAGQSMLKDLDPTHLDRVIRQNHALTGVLPFNGGSVGLTCGLLAMEGKNDVKSFLKVLGDFSKLLAVPQLSSALAIAGPVADGIAELVNATNGKLMLGLEQTFVAQEAAGEAVLRAGYYAVVLADEKELDPDKFWVDADQLKYGASIDAAKHLTKRNYMLLRIGSTDHRDDWDSLTTIQQPFESAIQMLQLQQAEKAAEFLRTAIAAAFTCKELTRNVDRRRVIERLKALYAEAHEQLGAGAFADSDPSLGSLMQDALSVEEAAARPEITAREVFKNLQ